MKNGKLQILFFLVDYKSNKPPDISVETDEMHFFNYDDEGKTPLSLMELWIDERKFDLDTFLGKVSDSISPSCYSVICIFDGGFFGNDNLLSIDNYDAVYLISIDGVVHKALNDKYRSSIEWKNVVLDTKEKLHARYLLESNYSDPFDLWIPLE